MAKNGDAPQNVADLADKLGFDPVLLGEFLCLVLSTMNLPSASQASTHLQLDFETRLVWSLANIVQGDCK